MAEVVELDTARWDAATGRRMSHWVALLLLLTRMERAGLPAWGAWIVFLALGGFAGNLALALLSLVVAVEDRFRVRIREDDAAVTRSLADLARLVAERTGAAKAEAAP